MVVQYESDISLPRLYTFTKQHIPLFVAGFNYFIISLFAVCQKS